MNRLKATNSVPFANRDIAPTTGTPQYATNGVPGVTPQTIWPAYAWNMVQDEIISVITAAGLTPDDTNWSQMLAAMQTMFRGQNEQAFTASGSWTCPSGVTKVRARVWGAGGGSGGTTNTSAAGGGGGGAYAEGINTVVPGTVYAVTVGSGGTASGANNGTAGGTSSFYSFLSATGGAGGLGSTGGGGAAGGSGGAASGGTALNIAGVGGGSGTVFSSVCNGGIGGGAFCSSSAGPSVNGSGQGGTFPGGGATGGAFGNPGSSGANGVVIIEY